MVKISSRTTVETKETSQSLTANDAASGLFRGRGRKEKPYGQNIRPRAVQTMYDGHLR
jgi:hypothetical protein